MELRWAIRVLDISVSPRHSMRSYHDVRNATASRPPVCTGQEKRNRRGVRNRLSLQHQDHETRKAGEVLLPADGGADNVRRSLDAWSFLKVRHRCGWIVRFLRHRFHGYRRNENGRAGEMRAVGKQSAF